MPLKKNNDNKLTKIAGLLQEACSLLKKKNIPSPELEAELLLAHTLKKERSFIITNLEQKVEKRIVKMFQEIIKKRLKGFSVAVLIGCKEFYGLPFKVTKDVLVPRPETEILVETVLKKLEAKNKTLVIDIGTGSGAIIISIFKNNLNLTNYFYASDKSVKALEVARKNARQQKAKIKFLEGDLLKPHLQEIKKIKPQNIIITANLPYLNPQEMSEPSIKKEPKAALLSGSDGLWHYKRLFTQLKSLKQSTVFLIGEINPEQALETEKLAKASFPQANISFINDYSSRIRFFVVEF